MRKDFFVFYRIHPAEYQMQRRIPAYGLLEGLRRKDKRGDAVHARHPLSGGRFFTPYFHSERGEREVGFDSKNSPFRQYSK